MRSSERALRRTWWTTPTRSFTKIQLSTIPATEHNSKVTKANSDPKIRLKPFTSISVLFCVLALLASLHSIQHMTYGLINYVTETASKIQYTTKVMIMAVSFFFPRPKKSGDEARDA